MKYFLFALLFTLATSTRAAEIGSQTAAAISIFTLSGIKTEVVKNTRMTQAQKNCIGKISNQALMDTYLPLVRKQLDPNKLTRFDDFFSSALGKRYLKAFSLSPSTAGYGAESFTQDEISIVRKTMDDPSFMTFARNTNVQNPGAPRDKILSLLSACN